jgi:hypothetical protein
MTPQRKRHQMLLLEEALHAARMDFNRRFLALREVKRKVVGEVNSRLDRLRHIHGLLGQLQGGSGAIQGEQLLDLELLAEEVPEAREHVSGAHE